MKNNTAVKKCFFVIAELNNAESKYKKFKKAITAYESSVQVTKSCWAVFTEKSSNEIWKDLSATLFSTDRVIIVLTDGEANWYNTICTYDWLHYHLGEGDEKAVGTAVKTAV